MSRETYRLSSFLDNRIVRASEATSSLPFDSIPDSSQIPPPQPVNYIFHNGFCCSTLLMRYLDVMRNSLALREPNSLYELASYIRFNGTNLFRPLTENELDKLFRYITYLISRRYNIHERVVVKPSDGCNNLIADLITCNPENHAVFLYSNLERFICSVFRMPEREKWVRVRLRELSLDKRRMGVRLPYHPGKLDRGQAATMVWMLQMENFRTILRGDDKQQVLVVGGEDIVEQPQQTLIRVANHFGLDVTPKELKDATETHIVSKDAKAQSKKYDRLVREEDFQHARAQHASEIDRAISWIENILGTDFINEPLKV
jgi:hypothetical protein